MAVIDLGSPAIDRAAAFGASRTVINRLSPSTEDGFITSVSVYSAGSSSGVKIGIFYNTSGNDYAVRSLASPVSIVAGLNTFSVNLAVEVGDFIGIYIPSTSIDINPSGATNGSANAFGDQTASTATYTLNDFTLSLEATGSTVSPANGNFFMLM